MSTQHKNIVEADLHEPKGVSTATSGKVYVATGTGSGTWALPNPKGSNTATTGQVYVSNGAGEGVWQKPPFGFVYFENIATPFPFSATTGFTKLNPTTTMPGISYLVLESTTAKITYQGPGEVMDILCNVSVDQASGTNKDIQFAIYKNGTTSIPGSIAYQTTVTTDKHFLTLSAVVSLATNDYIEVYVKSSAAATLNIYTFALSMDPH